MTGVDVWGQSSNGGGSNITQEDLNLRVLKTGDVMTGGLVMSNNEITGLPINFRALSSPSSAVSRKVLLDTVNRVADGKVSTTGGGMIGNLVMNGNFINSIHDPVQPNDACTKQYVDDRLLNIKDYSGVIPSLEANASKTGFSCYASSEHSSIYKTFNAFKLDNCEWAAFNTTSNFWIKIYCPYPLRVWKLLLSGRASGTERIFNWRFEGSDDNTNWNTLYSTDNNYIGSTPVIINTMTTRYFQWYRVYVVQAERANPGLSYFQIYKYLT